MLVQFILLIFQDFFLFLLLSFGIITENTNLWCKNSMMIKTIPIFRGICFLSFFLWNFSRKCCTIWKVLEAFCRGPEDPRSDRIYSSGNRGVKKGPGPRGTRAEEFLVPSLHKILTGSSFKLLRHPRTWHRKSQISLFAYPKLYWYLQSCAY